MSLLYFSVVAIICLTYRFFRKYFHGAEKKNSCTICLLILNLTTDALKTFNFSSCLCPATDVLE